MVGPRSAPSAAERSRRLAAHAAALPERSKLEWLLLRMRFAKLCSALRARQPADAPRS